MKQSLQLRLGQQITMTPQLQQAIRLLQLSTLELQLEVQQVLDSNIMLESIEDEYEEEIDFSEQTDEYEAPEESDKLVEDIPTELATDSEWDDIYDSTSTISSLSSNSQEDNNGKDFLLEQNVATETLQEHLYWQLDLTPFAEVDRAIAVTIIDGIDDDGYLQTSFEDIIQSLGNSVQITDTEIETVLRRIQHFDPLGIGARNLSECLMLQLAELEPNTPWLREAKILIRKYLSLLGSHDYVKLVKRMKLSREDLREVIELIQSLNPRPGSIINNQNTNYITPDVYVKKIKNNWQVELNPDISPKIRINSQYASLVKQKNANVDVSNLKSHLQEARWFIKSLKSRQETLLRVANCIVQRQAGFLDYGEEAMKPLVLHDIANELEMHESTVSRVTTQKYLHTPRGIFELKYFFSSHVSTKNGGECSSTAIRAMIKKLIAGENTTKPFSDSKIANLLADMGIKVARRTVAKYREAMVIPPSNERKRLE
ncbi:RNA polymerase factor sigma-54 [Candidatus Halobeggiatoa sp. HSG11]|nr:RNA polymerase factor sigma-54 [Candidatus Halobeggiatoa sp. HSG11]